jgi:hypothetical protein
VSNRIDVLLWANRVNVRAATAQPHELLDIAADASLDAAQDAFHKIAKLGHPDLHRGLDPDELEKVTSAYAAIANAYQAFRTAKTRGGPPPAPLGPIAAGAKVEPRTKRPSDQAAVRLPGGVIVGGRGATTTPPRPATARTKTPTGSPTLRPPTQPPPTQPPPTQRPPTQPPPMTSALPAPPTAEVSAPPVAATTSTTAAQAMNSKALVYYRKAEIALRRGDLRGASLNLKLAVAADPQSTYLRQALTKVEHELKQPP